MAKVAVAQMVSGEVLADNLATVAQLAEEAASASAKLLLLPENFALLDSKALVSLAREEVSSGNIQKTIASLAKKHNLWIIAGSVPLLSRSGDKVYASCLVFNELGVQVGRYDKIHLFDVDVEDRHSSYRESDFIEAGDQLVVVDSPFGKIGLSICYDLRFPEHYQKLRGLGAEILVVPSAFTYVTGEAHWEVLLRARGIETQCYVLAANQGGKHSETRSSWGHSMIVDPWGEVLALRESIGKGIVLADINLPMLHKRREAMPVMQHRKTAGF
ncbi:carbon-nitrogen hydrolase family protein [Neptuniibacter sp. 2_MG-2023]|uniref:carbon-nitrogen hydrolase family protein n=1 Tax=Neptuniibacter sp. 2_MG-2023 TaxID=3062671 RepID=UPI0026E30880|nr:carbon-nitrogen hydrolase family protein [Neptuniibacter sp. 2_MG-2023]MDO6514156.1 carbon-nitrogen hydrolase family protein [Neptuniibacter sp. 2_MG-2023]